jgi:SPP1 gp7 family putative phage head morphogenesis protein
MNQNEIKKLYTGLFRKIKKLLMVYDKKKINSVNETNLIKSKLSHDITYEVDKVYNKLKPGLITRLKKIANTNYLKTLWESEKKGKINISKKIINEVDKIVKNIVNRKVAGKTIFERFTRNKNTLLRDCKKIIKKMTFEGKSIDKIAKELRDKFNIDKNKSLLIARTEAHRIQEEATYKGYQGAKRAGVKFRIRWVSTLDSRTRDTHKNLDGKFADEDGYFHSSGGKAKYPGGFGIAKEDIRCRCTSIQVFDDLEGKNTRYVQETGEYIDYKTFDEWRNK